MSTVTEKLKYFLKKSKTQKIKGYPTVALGNLRGGGLIVKVFMDML